MRITQVLKENPDFKQRYCLKCKDNTPHIGVGTSSSNLKWRCYYCGRDNVKIKVNYKPIEI